MAAGAAEFSRILPRRLRRKLDPRNDRTGTGRKAEKRRIKEVISLDPHGVPRTSESRGILNGLPVTKPYLHLGIKGRPRDNAWATWRYVL